MRMAGVEATTTKTNATHECSGCGKRISDRFLLKAVDLYWHEDCLKCGCCDCRLGEVGSTLYKKANLLLCKRDYLRLFGTTGHCSACNKVIPAFEMVMRAKTNVYHLECFACQQCNHRFCVGDRFYLCDNKILCEYDYEERMVFASMSYSSDSLAHIKRQQAHESEMGHRNPAGPPLHPPGPPQQQTLPQQIQHSQPSQSLPPNPHLHPSNPPQIPAPHNQQQQMNFNGMGPFSGAPLINGPSTSSGLIPPPSSTAVNPISGGVGPLSMEEPPAKPVVNPLPGTATGGGPGFNGAGADDASSGYGSPDSLTLEDR